MPRLLHFIVRFTLSVIVSAALVSCAGRMFSDFDEPAANDPYDTLRGIGVWVVAVLIALLSEMIESRRKKYKAS